MIKNWTNKSIVEYPLDKECFGKYIIPLHSVSYDKKNPQIGILGADESADGVRRELYTLAYPFQNTTVLDLGNVKNINEADNIALILYLFSLNIIPIVLANGESHAKDHLESVIQSALTSSWIIVHSSLANDMLIKPHLDQAVSEGLIKVRYLGHQNHVTEAAALHRIQKLGAEAMRLGHIRQHIDRIEPWCRSIDHAIFHLDAMRKSDFKAQNSSNPGGFFYEEACKVCQFIGASSHLKSMAFYGYEPALDHDGQSAAVLAQLIWYMVDGFHHFREEQNIQKSKLTQYVVHAAHSELDINFWKNPESGRWWMEVPGHQDHWVSCTYDDYLEASQGEFSSRLISVLNRG